MSSPEPPILLFDGVCNLCNGWVRFVMAREREPLLRFAPLDSAIGRDLLGQHDLGAQVPDSFVFIENGRAYVRSAAALRIVRHLKAPWSWSRGLGVLPDAFLNAVYDLVARNRYRWFGRSDSCPLPTPAQQARFLS